MEWGVLMAVFKNCKNCGAKFRVSKDRRFYCCDDCRRIMGSYKKKKKSEMKSNLEAVNEIIRNARAVGMEFDYGDYVAKFGL